MNSKSLSFIGTIWLISVCAGFSQPNNDNFANRAQLTGNDVTFVGSLAGATIEPNEWALYSYPWSLPFSVWWSWTPTNSTEAHIVLQSLSQQLSVYENDVLAVYPGTNVFNTNPVSYLELTLGWGKLTLSFQAVAGTPYQIQFCGETTNLSATFELIATNAPLIVQQPIDLTVVTNGAALFTIVATGITPLHYQWRFNGSDIPGANDPMLAFDSVTNELAGEYQVVVSNSNGFAVSSPVRLTVNATATQPLLRAVAAASNTFSFALSGDSGRFYRIQSSTDLRNWQPELAFPQRWPMLPSQYTAFADRSLVLAVGSDTLFTIPRTGGAKYLRASLYTPANEICYNHLRQIRFAMDLWARETHQAFNALPADGADDLSPYWANIYNTACPLFGPGGPGSFYYCYTLQPLDHNPLCEVDPWNHVLETPDLTVLPP